jgi:hypothetical protein
MKHLLVTVLIIALTGCSTLPPDVTAAKTDEQACDQLTELISSQNTNLNLSAIALKEENFPTIGETIEQQILAIEEKARAVELAFQRNSSAALLVSELKSSSNRNSELLKSLKEMFDRYPSASTLGQWAEAIKQDDEVDTIEQLLSYLESANLELLDSDLAVSMFCANLYSGELD